MPDFCAAFGCSNERNAKTKEQGITFHRFPKDRLIRRAWRKAIRRKYFEPNDRSVICSTHFKKEDFDRTGQTTRLREGVVPSVPCTPTSSRTSEKGAAQSQEVCIQLSENLEQSTSDHQYALDPDKVKKKLTEAQEMVEELQRDLRNAKDRERRHKKTMRSLLEVLKQRNMLTEELQKKLDFYSGIEVHHQTCSNDEVEPHVQAKRCRRRRSAGCQQDHKKANKLRHSENEVVPRSIGFKSVSGKDSVNT
ncbi:THAP domain-containing protein 6-like isoform X2 [Mastacembelus armatus]|uniref:THAP domain-containing protein 6-like isoform X2 n=1 Tax=Mastacembelus armatus TaxID=205130 RepID=UPI000E45D673|nr:THAP domain-containing protein 6-like isoform X2 [Mastacembelus armatus]